MKQLSKLFPKCIFFYYSTCSPFFLNFQHSFPEQKNLASDFESDLDLEFETRLLQEIEQKPEKIPEIKSRRSRATNLYLDDDDLNDHNGSGAGEPDFTDPTVGTPVLTRRPVDQDDEDVGEEGGSGVDDSVTDSGDNTDAESDLTKAQIVTEHVETTQTPTTDISTTDIPTTEIPKTETASTTESATESTERKTTKTVPTKQTFVTTTKTQKQESSSEFADNCIDGKCPPTTIQPNDVGKYKNLSVLKFVFLKFVVSVPTLYFTVINQPSIIFICLLFHVFIQHFIHFIH